MSSQPIEERVQILENEVAQLKAQLQGKRSGVIGRTRPDFLQNYTGRSANNPLFDEVAEEIAAKRQHEREEVRRLAEAEENKP
jgi:hypothetical protein